MKSLCRATIPAQLTVFAGLLALYGGLVTGCGDGKLAAAKEAYRTCKLGNVEPEVLENAKAEDKEWFEQQTERCKIQEKDKQEAWCVEVATKLQNGTMGPEEVAALGSSSALADRVAKRTLSSQDFRSVTSGQLPCAEFAARSRIWEAYITAVTKSCSPWKDIADKSVFSSDLLGALKSEKYTLSPDCAQPFQSRLETMASAAVKDAKASAPLQVPYELCEIQQALHTAASPSCAYLGARYQTLQRQESAQSEADQRRRDALDAAQKAKEEAEAKRAQAGAEAKAAAEAAAAERREAACSHITELGERCYRRCGGNEACNDHCDMAVGAREKQLGCN